MRSKRSRPYHFIPKRRNLVKQNMLILEDRTHHKKKCGKET